MARSRAGPAHDTQARVTRGALAAWKLSHAWEEAHEVWTVLPSEDRGERQDAWPIALVQRLWHSCPWACCSWTSTQPHGCTVSSPHASWPCQAQPPGNHRTHVLMRGPPTFPRQPRHHSVSLEAVTHTTGRWVRQATWPGWSAVGHEPLHAVPAMAAHVHVIGWGTPCALLLSAPQTGQAMLAAVTAALQTPQATEPPQPHAHHGAPREQPPPAAAGLFALAQTLQQCQKQQDGRKLWKVLNLFSKYFQIGKESLDLILF